MNHCRVLLLCGAAVIVSVPFGCERTSSPSSPNAQSYKLEGAPPPPPAYDPSEVGYTGRFDSCKAVPRRKLSAMEECQLEKLRNRCTPADDCLVSCISSPRGYMEGGGCSHVCFFGPHQGEPRPPGWKECESNRESNPDQRGRIKGDGGN